MEVVNVSFDYFRQSLFDISAVTYVLIVNGALHSLCPCSPSLPPTACSAAAVMHDPRECRQSWTLSRFEHILLGVCRIKHLPYQSLAPHRTPAAHRASRTSLNSHVCSLRRASFELLVLCRFYCSYNNTVCAPLATSSSPGS